ncbi:MAG TPA: hypothetical protein VKV38_16110 [Trebonia sp.]|jgi:hypothetical protein|nr:hypothetical protein [Trebonia sp.]
MSGSDLIVAAPWIAFGIGVLVVCVRLFRHGRPGRAASRRPARSRRAGASPRRPVRK